MPSGWILFINFCVSGSPCAGLCPGPAVPWESEPSWVKRPVLCLVCGAEKGHGTAQL